jgi:hypothetical protein
VADLAKRNLPLATASALKNKGAFRAVEGRRQEIALRSDIFPPQPCPVLGGEAKFNEEFRVQVRETCATPSAPASIDRARRVLCLESERIASGAANVMPPSEPFGRALDIRADQLFRCIHQGAVEVNEPSLWFKAW